MMSGGFKDVSLLDGGVVSSGPRSFCDGGAAAVDRMDRMEHQIEGSSKNIISDTCSCFVKRRDCYWNGVFSCC